MELLTPSVSIRTTDTHQLLVRFQNAVSDLKHIDLQLLIPQQESATLAGIQLQLLTRAIATLQAMHASLLPRS